jgi:hypothetical protein
LRARPAGDGDDIGHRYDLACHALRDFLARNHVAFRWYDPRDPRPGRIGGDPAAG